MSIVHTLSSGSSGNSVLLSCDGSHLLIDAGISCRRITNSLGSLGLSVDDLAGILITHSHTDHIAGLKTLLKHSAVPIWSSEEAAQDLCRRIDGLQDRLCTFSLSEPFMLEQFRVTPFPTAHDAPGSCGFRFDTPEDSVGLMTDTGYITDEAAAAMEGVDLAILEANYNEEALRSGPYPYYLKQRILGDGGHLCNEEAADFAVTLAESGTSSFILAHLSRENNTPAMARDAVESALSAAGLFPDLDVAPRDHMSDAYMVRRYVCRK